MTTKTDDNIVTWSGEPWSVVTGCTKISAGCARCYAKRDAKRNQDGGSPLYKNGFKVTLHPTLLSRPLDWTRPRRVFVCSMSDLFHRSVPDDFVRRVFRVVNDAQHHQFMVLTKRSRRLASLSRDLKWTPNIAAGVTVEDARFLRRINDLRRTAARIKYVSAEPLLGPIPRMDLDGIDWVIVGGESGRGARPIAEDWVREIRDQVTQARIPFLFKQWGGENRRDGGAVLDGKIWDEKPALLV